MNSFEPPESGPLALELSVVGWLVDGLSVGSFAAAGVAGGMVAAGLAGGMAVGFTAGLATALTGGAPIFG